MGARERCAASFSSSDGAMKEFRAEMLQWPRLRQGGVRFDMAKLDGFLAQIAMRRQASISIEQHHMNHSGLQLADVQRFMLRKVQAELIGLTMALYGSAVGRVDVLHASHLMTMSYFLPMNDGSVMPMADIHKSKHGKPWGCHVS